MQNLAYTWHGMSHVCVNPHHRDGVVYLLEVTTIQMMVSQGIKASPVGPLHGSTTQNQDVGKHNKCLPNILLY